MKAKIYFDEQPGGGGGGGGGGMMLPRGGREGETDGPDSPNHHPGSALCSPGLNCWLAGLAGPGWALSSHDAIPGSRQAAFQPSADPPSRVALQAADI